MEENSNIEKISFENGVEIERLKSHKTEKNIMMVLFCAIFFLLICITVYVGSKSVNTNSEMTTNPPSDANFEQFNGQGMQPPMGMTPPDKPEGMDNNNMTPPDMPEGMDNNMTPPEKPEGMDGNITNTNTSDTLPAVYYVLFVIESLLLSSVAIYLLMSNFNDRFYKQTLGKTSSKLLYLLTLVIQTGILTIVECLITTKVLR